MMSFQSRPRVSRVRPVGRSEPKAADEQPAAPAGAGGKGAKTMPGWSSSSLELMEGLEVTEGVPLDELPAEWADRLARR